MKILGGVDRYLVQKDARELNEKIRSSHHPSEYSGCLRKMYFEWTKRTITNYRDATDIYRMMVGRWIHKGFADVLKEMLGDKVQSELEFTYEHPDLKYPIHGFMDNVFTYDEMLIGLELKTSFGRGIVSIAKSSKPRPEDEAQAKIYLAANEFITSFSLPYLGRDSFYRTEFDIQLTVKQRREFMEQVVSKFKTLETHLEKGEMPPRDFSAVVKDGEIKKEIQYNSVKYRSDWQCLYCVYRDGCYSKEIDDMGIHLPEKIKEGEEDEYS
jgi:hypothetical protein